MGEERSGGVVSFFAPAIPAWFTIDVDRRTWRALQLEMIGAAHVMHHRDTGFVAPTRGEPPRAAGQGANPAGGDLAYFGTRLL